MRELCSIKTITPKTTLLRKLLVLSSTTNDNQYNYKLISQEDNIWKMLDD